MIHTINFKSENLKGAYLYVPDSFAGPLPLVVWLTGGNDGAQLPLRFSLGKYLDRGVLAPDCAVLMPAAGYGKNYSYSNQYEMSLLVGKCQEYARLNLHNVGLCGWSLGAEAAELFVEQSPNFYSRLCLISNGGAYKPKIPTRVLVGEKEKSAKRNWPDWFAVEVIPGYGHEIGEKIWLDESIDLLDWLSKEE